MSRCDGIGGSGSSTRCCNGVCWRSSWARIAGVNIPHSPSTSPSAAAKRVSLIWVVQFERPLYFSVNWGTRLVVLPLMIAVLIEVFAEVFRPYSTFPKVPFAGSGSHSRPAVLLTAAACRVFSRPRSVGSINIVMVLNRSASIIFCGAFGFTALFSSYFGIPWQTRTYGIGVGFLLFMSVDLFTASLAAMYGHAI